MRQIQMPPLYPRTGGGKTAMKQLNELAGTAPSAAALLKTHLQRPWKTLRPGLITCHGSNGAIPSSCPQASAGPGRDMRAARTQQHRTTFSQERLHCPLSNERWQSIFPGRPAGLAGQEAPQCSLRRAASCVHTQAHTRAHTRRARGARSPALSRSPRRPGPHLRWR